MQNLKLEIPEIKQYPDDCVSPLFTGHPTMMYWINANNKFCKTNKDNCLGFYSECLDNERKISEFFIDKNYSECISPPSTSNTDEEGNLTIFQKAFYEGDLFNYLQEGNTGIETVVLFLESLKKILISLSKYKIIHGDLCLENFMVSKTDKLRFILVDFGCSQVLNEDKVYEWDFNYLKFIRPYLVSPYLQQYYKEKSYMNRDEFYNFLLNKELFTIGVILYKIVYSYDLWNPKKEYSTDEKFIELLNVRNHIKLCHKNAFGKLQKILEIILKLTPIEIDDIITLDEFLNLIDDLLLESNKKRKIDCTY
tara:strand:- start:813 stop:1739 length:927 start_codon:yes stop_codon:yes gene_type:complete